MLYFKIHSTEKYSIAMCYITVDTYILILYIDELNRYKVELAGCSKGGLPKLSNYPHRLGSLPAPGGEMGVCG